MLADVLNRELEQRMEDISHEPFSRIFLAPSRGVKAEDISAGNSSGRNRGDCSHLSGRLLAVRISNSGVTQSRVTTPVILLRRKFDHESL